MSVNCTICLDDLFGEDSIVESTPCGHCFHGGCVRRALQARKKCPSCREACHPYELKRLFVDFRDDAGAKQGLGRVHERGGVLEIDIADDDLDVPQLQANVRDLQRRLNSAEHEHSQAVAGVSQLSEEKADLVAQVARLKNELQSFQQQQQMHVLERQYSAEKLRKAEDSHNTLLKEISTLKAEKSQLETAAKMQRLSSEKDLTEQEIHEITRQLTRKGVDPKEVLATQTKNLVKANNMNRELMQRVQSEAQKKHELEVKLRSLAAIRAERDSLKAQVIALEEQMQVATCKRANLSESPAEAQHGDDIEDRTQPALQHIGITEPSIASLASSNHIQGKRTTMARVGGDAAFRPGLRIERPTGPTSSASATGRPVPPPSFVRAGPLGAKHNEGTNTKADATAGRFILSGADGRGGRKTVLRVPSAAKTGMAPWGSGKEDFSFSKNKQAKRLKMDSSSSFSSTGLQAHANNATNARVNAAQDHPRGHTSGSKENGGLQMGHFFAPVA